MIEIIKDDIVIHRSKNLRGILDHARREPVISVGILRKRPDGSGGTVTFDFLDDSCCVTDFANAHIAEMWVRARRSWGTPKEISVNYFLTVFDYGYR